MTLQKRFLDQFKIALQFLVIQVYVLPNLLLSIFPLHLRRFIKGGCYLRDIY